MDWIGLELSQNITPPRARCGANKEVSAGDAIIALDKLTALDKISLG